MENINPNKLNGYSNPTIKTVKVSLNLRCLNESPDEDRGPFEYGIRSNSSLIVVFRKKLLVFDIIRFIKKLFQDSTSLGEKRIIYAHALETTSYFFDDNETFQHYFDQNVLTTKVSQAPSVVNLSNMNGFIYEWDNLRLKPIFNMRVVTSPQNADRFKVRTSELKDTDLFSSPNVKRFSFAFSTNMN